MDDREKLDSLIENEKEKYRRAYQRLRYRSKSPHGRCLPAIQNWMREYGHDRYANFGCGSGLLDRHLLQEARGTLVDHVSVLWDDVREHPNLEKFVEASLFGDFEHFETDFAVCTDVMEHIPPEMVEKTLENIATRAKSCFFQISLNHSSERDHEKYGGHLHLTVETPEWWRKRLLNWYERLYLERTDTLPRQAPWEPDKHWYVVMATNLPYPRHRAATSRRASS